MERNTSRRRRQIDADIMFIGIEGVEENNEVNVEVVMGDQTISNGNLSTQTVLSFNLKSRHSAGCSYILSFTNQLVKVLIIKFSN